MIGFRFKVTLVVLVVVNVVGAGLPAGTTAYSHEVSVPPGFQEAVALFELIFVRATKLGAGQATT